MGSKYGLKWPQGNDFDVPWFTSTFISKIWCRVQISIIRQNGVLKSTGRYKKCYKPQTTGSNRLNYGLNWSRESTLDDPKSPKKFFVSKMRSANFDYRAKIVFWKVPGWYKKPYKTQTTGPNKLTYGLKWSVRGNYGSSRVLSWDHLSPFSFL